MTLKARIDNSGRLTFTAECASCGLPLITPSAGKIAYRKRGEPRPQFIHADCVANFRQTHNSGWGFVSASRLAEDLAF